MGWLSLRLIFFGGVTLNTARSCVAGGIACTMMLKLLVLVFPEVSTAVFVTTVVPSGKMDPEAGEQ